MKKSKPRHGFFQAIVAYKPHDNRLQMIDIGSRPCPPGPLMPLLCAKSIYCLQWWKSNRLVPYPPINKTPDESIYKEELKLCMGVHHGSASYTR